MTAEARSRDKFAGVPPVVRRLWSLLFRAERRHAQLLDEHRRALEELGRRLTEVEETLRDVTIVLDREDLR